MRPVFDRDAAQGLGASILDIAEARSLEVDADLDRAEAAVFGASEGAYVRCELPGICGVSIKGDVDFCGPCLARGPLPEIERGGRSLGGSSAPSGADTRRGQVRTSTASAASPETAMRVPTHPEQASANGDVFTVTRLDLVVVALLGACIALGAALILFAATLVVFQ